MTDKTRFDVYNDIRTTTDYKFLQNSDRAIVTGEAAMSALKKIGGVYKSVHILFNAASAPNISSLADKPVFEGNVAIVGRVARDTRDEADLAAWANRFNRDKNIETGVFITRAANQIDLAAKLLARDFKHAAKFLVVGHPLQPTLWDGLLFAGARNDRPMTIDFARPTDSAILRR